MPLRPNQFPAPPLFPSQTESPPHPSPSYPTEDFIPSTSLTCTDLSPNSYPHHRFLLRLANPLHPFTHLPHSSPKLPHASLSFLTSYFLFLSTTLIIFTHLPFSLPSSLSAYLLPPPSDSALFLSLFSLSLSLLLLIPSQLTYLGLPLFQTHFTYTLTPLLFHPHYTFLL